MTNTPNTAGVTGGASLFFIKRGKFVKRRTKFLKFERVRGKVNI